MASVAIVETKPSKNNYSDLFNNEFEFDLYQLTSDPNLKKVLRKDVDIDINIDEYEFVILVGSESLKYFTKYTAITSYSGRLVDEKFLPTINPAMIRFKPEAKKPWIESRNNIIKYVKGENFEAEIDKTQFVGIEDEEEALQYVRDAIVYDDDVVGLDSETSALYPRDGYILGISLTYKPDSGAYISSECISPEVEEALQELFNKKAVIFHNAKFDLAFFEYHFGFKFPRFHDTMLMHYTLDETPGTHGLKDLAMKFTKYGDYEQELVEWRENYCRKHKMRKGDFTYDLIPFDVMYYYAAVDSCVTYLLFKKFKYYLDKNSRLMGVYRNILIPGCRFLTDIQDNGVPFNKERLLFAQKMMEEQIAVAVKGLSKFPEIAKMEDDTGKQFNPNSTIQLRKLLFDYVGLKPTGKKTGKGADSTDAEVLTELAEQHEIPKYILDLRKSLKIKSTYIDKIIPQLDMDSRLRTNFNLHMTTSGRLSSSGKLNMQQLPRDNPTVKGCIKASPGHKIVAMDL